MLMESAPGLVNWHPFNKMKRPGVHRLASLQAVALGSDTVQYFQWRKEGDRLSSTMGRLWIISERMIPEFS